jgi:hypothetical protein
VGPQAFAHPGPVGFVVDAAEPAVNWQAFGSLLLSVIVVGLGHLPHRLGHRVVAELNPHQVRFETGAGRFDWLGERDHVGDEVCCSGSVIITANPGRAVSFGNDAI